MKRYLPFIVLGVGLLVVVGAILASRGSGKPNSEEIMQDETAPEIPFDQRPVGSLTPKADGHWLTLNLKNVNRVANGAKLEYEIFYTAGDGRGQGSSGTVDLSTTANVDNRDILLGSESSGKFRYDTGVEKGTLTLKWRDTKGKLAGKLVSEWHLQTGTDALTSIDETFKYKLDKMPAKEYFIVMHTFGVPQGVNGTKQVGPFGVFTSGTAKYPGTVTLSGDTIWLWNEASWTKVSSNKSPNIGIFVSSSN